MNNVECKLYVERELFYAGLKFYFRHVDHERQKCFQGQMVLKEVPEGSVISRPISATQKHLEDMQKISFQLLEQVTSNPTSQTLEWDLDELAALLRSAATDKKVGESGQK